MKTLSYSVILFLLATFSSIAIAQSGSYTIASVQSMVDEESGKYGLYDPGNGTWVLQPIYDSINQIEVHRPSVTSYYKAYINNRVGVYNDTGEEIFPPIYRKIIESSPAFTKSIFT